MKLNLPRISQSASRGLAALALVLAAPLAQAAYFQWEMVELPASSGASCGNGTPYRFFVNRTFLNRDVMIMYEGGGACWDQNSCEGKGALSASNPNGIPADYMSNTNYMPAGGLVTPFTSRSDPFQSVRTQNWNLVYLPYCTGDVHTGNKVRVYDDANPAAPRLQYHRGQANVRAASQWIRNNMGRPNQLLMTGFSAGGVGSTATYALARDILAPSGRASLLADSGPLMPAPRTGSSAQFPSVLMHNTIRAAWGLDEPGGLIPSYANLPGFDTNDLGTVANAMAKRYPSDRFGYVVFGADGIFSAFSYAKFYADIANEPDANLRKQRTMARWQQDIAQWLPQLGTEPNIAWHVPYFRNFNSSHCLTIVDFSNTFIEDKQVGGLSVFLDNTLDRGIPMRNQEMDQVSDLSRPDSFAMGLLKVIQAIWG